MGALEDVTAKLDEMEAANVARSERLAVDVAELRRLIAAGGTQQDFAPVIARLDAHIAALKGEDVDPNFPAASPPPAGA